MKSDLKTQGLGRHNAVLREYMETQVAKDLILARGLSPRKIWRFCRDPEISSGEGVGKNLILETGLDYPSSAPGNSCKNIQDFSHPSAMVKGYL